jgi:hypothetical protein
MNTPNRPKAKAFVEACGDLRGVTRQRAAQLLRAIRQYETYYRVRLGGGSNEYRATGRAIIVIAA